MNLVTNDISAHQEINNMVRELSSSRQKLKIIHIITVIGLVFAIFSIGGSAYGVYYDMLLDYGNTTSIVVGLLVGLTIEAVKMVGVWGFFAYAKLHLKLIFFMLLALFTSFAIQLHFIGATNMELTKRVQVIQEIQKKNMAYKEDENERKNKIVELMGGVLKNGTSRDDKIAAKTLAQIDTKEQSLYSQGKISELDHAEIETVKDAAKKRGNSMRKLLPLFEIFSIFGLLGAYLKTQSVSGDVKEVIEVIDTHIEKESSKLYADEALNAQEAENVAYVKRIIAQKERGGSNALQTEPLKKSFEDLTDEEKQIILDFLRKGSVVEQNQPKRLPHQEIIDEFKNEIEREEQKLIPSSNKGKPVYAEILDDIEEEVKEEREENSKEPKTKKVKALDYSNLDYEKQMCIKLMFRYGDVEVGDELMTQAEVKKKLKEKGFKRVDALVSVVYGRLKDDGYISATGERNRYVAKAQLPEIFWVEKEVS